jgi:hypothetical protein
MPKNIPTPNTHTLMTLKNLRIGPNDQLLVPLNNNLHEAIRFWYARFIKRSIGLETKLVKIEDLVLHDKVIKVWVCDITKPIKMTRN